EIGRDCNWGARIPDRLQCKPQHQSGETSKFRCLRRSRKRPGKDARWHSHGKSDGRRKRPADPRSRNAETCESDWLVCGGVRDRAGFNESNEYWGDTAPRRVRCLRSIGHETWPARDRVGNCRDGSQEMPDRCRKTFSPETKLV